MNSTIRQLVSELANDVNAIRPDARISKRYLYQKIQASTNYYIRQIPLVDLIKNSRDYDTIDCFPMETVPVVECCSFDIPMCQTVQRSKNEVPDTYGSTLVALTLNNIRYTVLTAEQYQIILDDEFYNPEDKYAWIENKHLYIPNSNVETIKVGGYFTDTLKARESECGFDNQECYSPLDEVFNIPGRIRSIVMKDALQSILTGLQIPRDETPNQNLNQK